MMQMLLLYDSIILVSPHLSHSFDLSDVIDNRFVKVLTIKQLMTETLGITPGIQVGERFSEIAWYNVGELEYVNWLKPLIVEAMMRNRDGPFDALGIAARQALRAQRTSKEGFYSGLFDYFYRGEGRNRGDVIQMLTSVHEAEASENRIYYQPFVDDLQRLKISGYSDGGFSVMVWLRWITELNRTILTLMGLLEASVQNDALLVQSRFRMEDLEADRGAWSTTDVASASGAYQVIRLKYEEVIGALPHTLTVEDVLRLKDKRPRDIRRLRDVLSGVEQALRDCDHNALIRADRDIRSASADLARGNTVGKVGRWVSYMAVPVGILGFVNMPAAIASFGLTLVGGATTFGSKRAEELNGWLQVIR